MNYTAEQINDAFSNLSSEEAEAMFQVDIDAKINEIGNNYNLNTEATSILSLYTTLSIIGLIKKEEFSQIIKNEFLNISEKATQITLDVDKDIFEEIKKIIQKKKERRDIIEQNQKEVIDHRFDQIPENTQSAIEKSNWRETLYDIAKKYKLNIEQMGVLEDATVGVISNTIHPDSYEKELSSKILIPKEDLIGLVNDVNDKLLKKIREIMKNQESTKKEVENDDIPLPPYKKITITNNLEANKEDEDIEVPIPPKENTLEIQREMPTVAKNLEIPNETEIPKPTQITPNIFNVPKNIVEEKLKGATSSKHSTSDYSTPSAGTTSSKSHDPYREEI